MANDTQLKAAIGTYNALSKLMKKAFAQKIKYANLQTNANKPKISQLPQSPPQSNQPPPRIDISKVFMHFDIKETSLHLQITNLNVHLYADDNYSGNKQIDGGAMQILFKNLCIDHYPYHKIGSSITHWHNYNYAFKQRDEWSKTILAEFVVKLESILNKSEQAMKDLNQFKLKNNINLLEACTNVTLKDLCVYKVTTNMSDRSANISAMKTTKKSQQQKPEGEQQASPLYTPNDVLKKPTYFLDQQVFDRRPFLSSNYAEFNLPADETLFAQVLYSEFYFPDECNYPVPAPQLFVQCSPVCLNVDFLSLLWMNTLMFSLYREKLIVDESESINSRRQRTRATTTTTTTTTTSVSGTVKTTQKEATPTTTPTISGNTSSSSSSSSLMPSQHCDTYVELITPKVVLSIYPHGKLDYLSNTFLRRPSSIELGVARLLLTNQIAGQNQTSTSKKFSDLKSTSDRCYNLAKQLGSKYTSTFASSHELTLHPLSPCFGELIKNENCAYQRCDLSCSGSGDPTDTDPIGLVNTTRLAYNAKEGLFLKSLSKNALNKTAARDLWSVEFESAWIDFRDGTTNENTTFVENTSFRLYAVNVWDFYSNGGGVGGSEQPTTTTTTRPVANYERACDRLSKLIELNNTTMSLDETATAAEHDDEENVDDNATLMHTSTSNRSPYHHNNHKRRSASISSSSPLSSPSTAAMAARSCLSNPCKRLYSQMNVIGEIREIRMTVNHAQVLFLLRLVDVMDLFMNQLKIDSEHTLKYKSNNNAASEAANKESRPKIKCLNLDDLAMYLDAAAAEDTNSPSGGADSTSINMAVSIHTIEVDLVMNDLRKPSKSMSPLKEDLINLDTDRDRDVVDDDDDVLSSQQSAADELATTTIKAVTTTPPSSDLIDINREFILGFVKYIYGLSSDNPNQSFKFSKQQQQQQQQNQPMQLSVLSLSTDSGIVSSDKASFTVSYSASSSASSLSQQQQQQQLPLLSKGRTSSVTTTPSKMSVSSASVSATGGDTESLFADDGDNLSLIMSLENDDLINIELGTTTNRQQQQQATSAASVSTQQLSSESVSNLSVTAATVTSTSGDSINKSDPDLQSCKPVYKDHETQTDERLTKIRVRLGNLSCYVQNRDDAQVVMAKVGRVRLQDRHTPRDAEILVRVREIPRHPECAKGLVDVCLDRLTLDAYMFTVQGLVELFDDDDEEGTTAKRKETIPVNIVIKNSRFNISENENYAKIENDPKMLPVTIERLELKKQSDGRIVIKEMRSPDDWTKRRANGLLSNASGLRRELDYLNQFKYDLTFLEFNSKFKFHSDKFASLVHLLRRSKEANAKLEAERAETRRRLEKSETENKRLRDEIDAIKKSSGIDEAYLDAVLRTLREENEMLRGKLAKADENVKVLKIEREKYLALLNEK